MLGFQNVNSIYLHYPWIQSETLSGDVLTPKSIEEGVFGCLIRG